MFAAIDGESEEREALADELGILHVVLDGGTYLLLTFRGEDGFSTTLGDVAGTIEFAALATIPEGVEACSVGTLQLFGDNGIATTYTCESCCLREAAELDGTFLRSFNLVDGVGQGVILNEGLVSGIVEDECLFSKGVIDPFCQLLLGDDSTSRVIGVTEIDDVKMLCWDVACKAVASMTGDIFDVASSHDVGVHIDGIDRVCDAHEVVGREDVSNITCVALGTIADKHLFAVELDAPRSEVVLDDGINEEVVTVFRTIAPECLAVGTFIHSTMHRLDGCIRQGTGHVTDAQTDDVRLWMFCFVGIHLLGYLSKEVAVGELQIVCVDANHESIYDWTIYNLLFVLQIAIYGLCCLAS